MHTYIPHLDPPARPPTTFQQQTAETEPLEVKQVEPGLWTVAVDHPALLLGNPIARPASSMVMEYLPWISYESKKWALILCW